MIKFDIILKNEKEKTYRIIIFLFVILHMLFFFYLLFDVQLWKTGVSGLVIMLLYCGYRLLITHIRHKKFSFGSGIFFFFISVFPIDSWWFWGIELVLFTLSSIALVPITLSFTTNDAKKTGFPPKTYHWNDFSNIVIKDNILTLDFKNNKLMQAEIATQNINEHDFNIFAIEQIAKSS